MDIAAGDHSLFESGAILIYLADKTGQFMPASPRGRYAVLQWLMFKMGHVGPMLGQAHHFRQYAPEKGPYAVERYASEPARLCRVVAWRLADGHRRRDAQDALRRRTETIG